MSGTRRAASSGLTSVKRTYETLSDGLEGVIAKVIMEDAAEKTISPYRMVALNSVVKRVYALLMEND